MSITFGSVGDIISVCLLVKDLVELLDNSRGSPGEYHSLVRELYSLDRSLLQVDLFCRAHTESAELGDICEVAERAVHDCQQTLEELSKRIEKYDANFQKNGSGKVIKDAAMKLRWHMSEKEVVAKFRTTISHHVNSLNILLATANAKLNSSSTGELKDLKATIEAGNDEQKRLLSDVQAVQQKQFSLVFGWKPALRSIFKTLGNVQKACISMSNSVKALLDGNVTLLRAVQSIQSGLPTALECTLIEKPFILEDPIGRIAPVHLQFVESWDAFEAVLEIRFRGIQGFDKIQQRKYALQDRARGLEISRSRPWKGAFLPGQRVDMSFVFERTISQNAKPAMKETSCPSCGCTAVENPGLETECQRCGMWYRRITEVQEVEPLPLMPLPRPWIKKPVFGVYGFTPSETRPNCPMAMSKRKSRTDEDSESILRSFKRVRVVSKQINVRSHKAFRCTTKHPPWSLGEKDMLLPSLTTFAITASLERKSSRPLLDSIVAKADNDLQTLHRPLISDSHEDVSSQVRNTSNTSVPQSCDTATDAESAGKDSTEASNQALVLQLQEEKEIQFSISRISMPPSKAELSRPGPTDVPHKQETNAHCDKELPTFEWPFPGEYEIGDDFEYKYEHGRRYHAFEDIQYLFPNDDLEQDRQAMLDLIIRIMCDEKLHFAPVENHFKIIDIGTGEGSWVIDMGDAYPEAKILGTDISPIQPRFMPPNVGFVVEDLEDDWDYPFDLLDLVHVRNMDGAIQDWSKMLSQAYRTLKPGGWIEIQDMLWRFSCEDGTMQLDYGPMRMMEHIEQGLAVFGVEFHSAEKHRKRLENANFININHSTERLPLGSWPRDRKLETVGSYCQRFLLDGLEALTLGPLIRGLNWTEERVREFLGPIRRDLRDRSIHSYVSLHSFWAQKPVDATSTQPKQDDSLSHS